MDIKNPKVGGAMLIAIGRTMIACNIEASKVMDTANDAIRLALFKTVLEQEDDAEQFDLSEAVYMLEEDLLTILGDV